MQRQELVPCVFNVFQFASAGTCPNPTRMRGHVWSARGHACTGMLVSSQGCSGCHCAMAAIRDSACIAQENGAIFEALRTMSASYLRADTVAICDCIQAFGLNDLLFSIARLERLFKQRSCNGAPRLCMRYGMRVCLQRPAYTRSCVMAMQGLRQVFTSAACELAPPCFVVLESGLSCDLKGSSAMPVLQASCDGQDLGCSAGTYTEAADCTPRAGGCTSMADGAACLGLGSGLRDAGRPFPEYRSSLESQARARHNKLTVWRESRHGAACSPLCPPHGVQLGKQHPTWTNPAVAGRDVLLMSTDEPP